MTTARTQPASISSQHRKGDRKQRKALAPKPERTQRATVPLEDSLAQADSTRCQAVKQCLRVLTHASLPLSDVLTVEGEKRQTTGNTGGDAGPRKGTRTHDARHDGNSALACRCIDVDQGTAITEGSDNQAKDHTTTYGGVILDLDCTQL